MVSALVSGLSSLGSSPSSGPTLCCVLEWARHFTLTVPLSTQVHKCDRLASHPGEVETFLVAPCYRNWDNLQPGGSLGSCVDFLGSCVDYLFTKEAQRKRYQKV